MPRFLLLINNWNEEAALEQILPLLKQVNRDLGDELVIVFVDNHSVDLSRNLISQFGFRYLLQPSQGLRSAFQVGIDHALKNNFEFVIFAQSDGNCDFLQLKGLIDHCLNGDFDMVVASRYVNQAESDDDTFITRIGNKFFTKLISLVSGYTYTDALVGYRMVRLSVIQDLDLTNEHLRYWKPERLLHTSLAWDPLLSLLVPLRGLKVSEYFVAETPRIGGEEKKRNFVWGIGFLIWVLQVIYFRRNIKQQTRKL